ncbi:MAG: RsmB/NOP family class I SAM-dependent RNA methyltransferase [Clostridiales bacterium]|nr:RsmB/NOP family class I SAM-dependent RNA methyltransferase [Clostridiales bacterium]
MLPAIPALLTERLIQQYGEGLAREIEAGFVRRPVTLRVNTLRSTPEQVMAVLENAGIAYERQSWYPDAFVLPGVREDAVQSLPEYEAGHMYLQSLSSMMPALVLSPKKGESILDMAAAPGGKTTQMAALSGNAALITACEKNRIRADRLQFNLDRQGASRVSVMCTDARQLNDLFRFDKVLLDAPCTGSGTILIAEGEQERRMTADWVAKTAKTQKAMLKKALTLLSAGHEMVYSTCSILREENEEVLNAVLPGMNAEVVPIDPAALGLGAEQLLPVIVPGVVCVKPTALHEGFFVAKIRKRK